MRKMYMSLGWLVGWLAGVCVYHRGITQLVKIVPSCEQMEMLKYK